ncbi:uncharacterized protein LOC127239354 [Andrographis paniculata]|uniref:uncharacterized protein LOC127239354 n=1 Tax=Andrographis paniculata TaxID=175694 RepID=UPI0021E7085D|nr:uncharacterized protein LOC127239354 [Andrographis paniculata]
MAVTHADLAPSPKSTDLGSKTGVFLMVLSILLGLACFILCLIAEATRSEAKGTQTECVYTANGKLPLITGTAAFLALASAMVVQHTYLLLAVSRSDALLDISWDPVSDFAKVIAWQAGFFFIATWVSFAMAEILLLIGISVESGHLKNWARPHPSCLTIPQGLFIAAGVFGLVTVFFTSGLYITALRAENFCRNRERTRREILEAAAMYASPPRPRSPVVRAAPNEGPMPGHDQNMTTTTTTTLYQYLTAFEKPSSLV